MIERADFQRVSDWIRLTAKEKCLFFSLLGGCFLYFLPILLAGDYYNDDWLRSWTGGDGWKILGRPVAEFVIRGLQFGRPLQDIGPMAQLLSIAGFAYVMVLFARRYYAPAGRWRQAGCLGLAIMSPFFFEMLSYRYDSISMMLSVCLVILCYALPENLGAKRCFCISVGAAFLMFGSYQATAGMYISMAFLEFLLHSGSFHDGMKQFFSRALAFLAAGMAYKVMLLGISLNEYAAGHSSFLRLQTEEGWHLLGENFRVFAELLHAGGLSFPRTVMGLFFAVLLYGGYRFVHEGRGLRFALAIPGMAVGILLPQVFLQSPVLSPRVLLASCTWFVFLGILMNRMSCWKKNLAAILLIVFLLAGFDFAYAYGNVLHRQTEYEMGLEHEISSDLGRLDPDMQKPKLAVLGDAPLSKELQLAEHARPVFHWLVPRDLREGYWVGLCMFAHASARKVEAAPVDDALRKKVAESAPVFRRDVYDIYATDDTFIIRFKDLEPWTP